MTLPLEHLPTDTPIGRNFAITAQRALSLGGSVQGDVRIGVATVTWDGSHATASATVSHGLGRTPIVVLVTPQGGPFLLHYAVSTFTATTFALSVPTSDGSFPAAATTRDIYWLVIG
jgi:hypothetical protein